eukprot:CAMPEP_0197025122 /NCGR_PEP_ID=MMETSP1384-20130603/5547_1 /TAXON_ID=29189 /ORGANISM="Ammonia sp." /LENGTH=287 /DNA_ID=CAMNT_0042453613 /DNA_START=34 /DNA_END=893 /DNA_ORIENTATION=+
MAGSALLWRGGHYSFGNADSNAAANRNGYGDQLLQQEQERQARMQNNSNPRNADVTVAEDENSLLNPKKRKGRPPYDVNVLMSEKGLDGCYQLLSTLQFKGAGHERSDLKKLIHHYQQWAYFMYPAMNFKDIVKKTLTFSSKNQIKNHLQRMRDKRDGFDLDAIGDEDEDMDLMNNDNDSNANSSNVVGVGNEEINGDRNNSDNNNNRNQENNDFEMRQQRQLPREADDTVIQMNANRNDENKDNSNHQEAGNGANNNNDNDFDEQMEYGWGDPDEFEPDDHDIEIA